MTREMWGVAEVAEYASLSPSTVRAYASRGEMPGPTGRFGREPWWTPGVIMEWRPPIEALCPVCCEKVDAYSVEYAWMMQDSMGFQGGPGHFIQVGGRESSRPVGFRKAMQHLPGHDEWTFEPCGHFYRGEWSPPPMKAAPRT